MTTTDKIKTRAAIDYRMAPKGEPNPLNELTWEIIIDGRIAERLVGNWQMARDRVDYLRRQRRNADRRARHQAYTDAGMTRVKGALGGTYYE